jgi:hypothetical protein
MAQPLEGNAQGDTGAREKLGPVKLFEFLRAPVGSTEPGIHERWAEERTAWLGERPELAQYLWRHELYERPAVDEGRPRAEVEMPDTGFEAVSVQWFESLAAYDALRTAPGATELRDLDLSFRRMPAPSVLTGPPDIIVGPPGGDPSSTRTLICILRHAPGMDLAKFHDHWLHHHGGLFQTLPELRDPLLGYEQNHGLNLADAEYDGVTQQWFASIDTWTTSLEVPAHAEIVGPDMEFFLDPESINFIIAEPPKRIFG